MCGGQFHFYARKGLSHTGMIFYRTSIAMNENLGAIRSCSPGAFFGITDALHIRLILRSSRSTGIGNDILSLELDNFDF